MKYALSLAVLVGLSVAGCATSPQLTAQDSQFTIAQASGGPNCRRLAKPGDTKIQIYCSDERAGRAWAAGGRNCRVVSRVDNDQMLRFCGRGAEWEQFDTWAVSRGITCRWVGPTMQRQEFCMTSAQWQAFEKSPTRFAGGRMVAGPSVSGPNWPGNGGGGGSGGSGFGYATSYGYFPAGGAIGSTP